MLVRISVFLTIARLRGNVKDEISSPMANTQRKLTLHRLLWSVFFYLHRRIVVAFRLRKSAALPTPCLGRFRCAKNNTQLFFACLSPPSHSRRLSPSQAYGSADSLLGAVSLRKKQHSVVFCLLHGAKLQLRACHSLLRVMLVRISVFLIIARLRGNVKDEISSPLANTLLPSHIFSLKTTPCEWSVLLSGVALI